MLLHTVGNTGLFSLSRLISPGNIFLKLEKQNPSGSIKDRAAYFMILDAERKGLLSEKKRVIVEPTSGNTGISLSLIGAQKGYKVILVMPDNMSIERIKLLKLLGAEVVLTPSSEGMKGAIEKAKEITKREDAYLPDQFSNPMNVLAHELTTGPELLSQMNYDIDIFVTGIGTGGTITGVARALRKALKGKIKIIGVEPKNSAVISGGTPGIHKIQGIGAGFIPSILDLGLIDDIIPISDHEALDMTRKLAKIEGLSSGISTGANVAAAMFLLKKCKKSCRIATVSPDSMDKYLSILEVT